MSARVDSVDRNRLWNIITEFVETSKTRDKQKVIDRGISYRGLLLEAAYGYPRQFSTSWLGVLNEEQRTNNGIYIALYVNRTRSGGGEYTLSNLELCYVESFAISPKIKWPRANALELSSSGFPDSFAALRFEDLSDMEQIKEQLLDALDCMLDYYVHYLQNHSGAVAKLPPVFQPGLCSVSAVKEKEAQPSGDNMIEKEKNRLWELITEFVKDSGTKEEEVINKGDMAYRGLSLYGKHGYSSAFSTSWLAMCANGHFPNNGIYIALYVNRVKIQAGKYLLNELELCYVESDTTPQALHWPRVEGLRKSRSSFRNSFCAACFENSGDWARVKDELLGALEQMIDYYIELLQNKSCTETKLPPIFRPLTTTVIVHAEAQKNEPMADEAGWDMTDEQMEKWEDLKMGIYPPGKKLKIKKDHVETEMIFLRVTATHIICCIPGKPDEAIAPNQLIV